MKSMGILLLISIMILIDLYVYQGVRLLSESVDGWLRIVWRASFWVFSGLSVFATILFITGKTLGIPEETIVYLRTLLFIFYASKIVFALFIGLDDLRRGLYWAGKLFPGDSVFERPNRSIWLTNLAFIAASIPFFSLLYGMLRNPYRYQVHKIQIQSTRLDPSDTLRIVQLSDIHSGSLRSKSKVEKAIPIINNLKPDLVLFTGDLVNNQAREMEDYVPIFSKIESNFGTYSILGNHDYGDYIRWPSKEEKERNMESLYKIHEQMGWNLLLNEHRIIKIRNLTVNITGVENFSTLPQFPKYGNLEEALRGSPSVDYHILLSHDPTHWEAEVVSKKPQIDLTLSGHTHGFQFGFEFSNNIRWSPSQYIYRQWAGKYEKENQTLYVNRGFGFLGYPGRVGILPEITFLEITGIKQ